MSPIPDTVYGAALRTIARFPCPDDAATLARGAPRARPAAPVTPDPMQLALAALRHAIRHGIGRLCVG